MRKLNTGQTHSSSDQASRSRLRSCPQARTFQQTFFGAFIREMSTTREGPTITTFGLVSGTPSPNNEPLVPGRRFVLPDDLIRLRKSGQQLPRSGRRSNSLA